MENFTNNIIGLDYQNWKKSINQILLYKHFKKQAEEKNNIIAEKMIEYQQCDVKTPAEGQKYMTLLQQVVFNCSQVYKNVKDNSNNEKLLKQLQEQKNIDLSEESFKRWQETGEKIKL